MADSPKLSISLQLVGLTAVVVFCFAGVSVIAYARAIWRYWDTIYSVSNWYTAFAPVALALFACVASIFAFLALLRTSHRTAAQVAMVYLAYLLVLVVWHAAANWSAGAERGLVAPDAVRIAAIAFQAFCAAWLGMLLYRMWSQSRLR